MTLRIPSESPTSITQDFDKKVFKKYLKNNLILKQQNNILLNNDPALKNMGAFKNSIDQLVREHQILHPEQVHAKKTHATIAILGNSFSWQGHVINYFNTHPPTQHWKRTKVIHIAYSSSYLEKSKSITEPFQPRQENGKHTYHAQTRRKILKQIPRNEHLTIVDMVNTGAGLASFLKLKSRSPQPKLLAFIPKEYAQPDPLKNNFFNNYQSRSMAIQNQQALEHICNDVDKHPIRGSQQTKIYDPPPSSSKKDPLFHIKLSILILEMQKHYQTPIN